MEPETPTYTTGCLLGRPVVYLFLFAYFFDWFTTYMLLQRGGTEGNLFLTDYTVWGLLALKVVTLPLIFGMVLLLARLNKRYGKIVTSMMVVWFAGLSIWNVGLIA